MNGLSKHYNFKESEIKWQQAWESEKVYEWDKNTSREDTFVVDTPPPTVSGQLHMGHIFSYTQADFVVRYKRMRGLNIFYPMGFDDNGLPTERLVEKKQKIRAHQLERSKFIEICREIVKAEEEKFRSLFRSIALSVDWGQEYQSISPQSQAISQMSFLDLVQKGEIYRENQPILWDPIDQTSLAQADVEDKESPSFMNDILFETEEGEKLTIATTRPELLPACVCVFYHPDDDRYKHLKGKYAITPLFRVKVPILEDRSVAIDKGTGLVMCCTFGDMTDVHWWKIHKLPLRMLLNKYGKISDLEFDQDCTNIQLATKHLDLIKGKKVKEAREIIIEEMKSQNLLVNQAAITHTVKSGGALEIITAPGWFVKTLEHKEALLKRSAEINWYPKHMKVRLDNWINSIAWDWCISRQRFFGVAFPVWYSKRTGEEGKPIFAEKDQLPVDPIKDLPKGYSREEVEPDMDVMDTWATSSVSPQLSSCGISGDFAIDIERHNKLFPSSLRPQAHEIIRTWAFYTMLKAHLHQNVIPWENIMVSGWCLAEDKSKMSKSKGNIIDPTNLIETYGADVVRYWASTSRLGADTAYSEDVIKDGKRLVNKIWNAAKFASIHFEKIDDFEQGLADPRIVHNSDKWIISKLHLLVKNATEDFEKFEYAMAMEKIEEFFWKDFCDNYLEIAKKRSYNEGATNDQGQESAIISLYWVLHHLLRLFAPIIPHITDELFSKIYNAQTSVHTKNMWPILEEVPCFNDALEEGKIFIEALELVRKAKAERKLSIKAPLARLELSHAISEDMLADLFDVTSTDISLKPSEEVSLEGRGLTLKIAFS